MPHTLVRQTWRCLISESASGWRILANWTGPSARTEGPLLQQGRAGGGQSPGPTSVSAGGTEIDSHPAPESRTAPAVPSANLLTTSADQGDATRRLMSS